MNPIIWLQLNNEEEGEENQNEKKKNFSQGGHDSEKDDVTHLTTANTSTEA